MFFALMMAVLNLAAGGDVNCDGAVDLLDFAHVQRWENCPPLRAEWTVVRGDGVTPAAGRAMRFEIRSACGMLVGGAEVVDGRATVEIPAGTVMPVRVTLIGEGVYLAPQ